MAKISPSTFTSLLGTFAKVGLNAVLCLKGMPADSSMLISELAGGMFTSFDFDLNDNPLKKFYKLVLKSLRASLEESGLNLRNDQLTAMADSMFSINEMQYFQAQNPDSIDRLRDGFRNCLQYQTAFSDAEMANYDLDAILASLLEKIQQGITQDQGLTSLAAYRTVTNVADDVKEIKRMLAALDQDKDSFPKVLTPIAPFLPDSFIHRDQELADVLAWFSSGKHVLVISGMGGLGKSSLARAVCGRLEKEIDHLAWLTYSGDLEVDLLNLRLWEANPDRNSRFVQIRNFLSSTEKQVLIVLDNVNEKPSSDYLNTLAAFSPTTRVLLTSRLPNLRGFEVYPLGFLSADQCADLFYQYYSGDRGGQHSAIVRQIAASVGRHTLTVELIARSAEVEAETLPALWDRLQKAGFTFSEAMLESSWRPEEHTLQQHLRALFSLADLDQEKQRVMRVFSILPPSAPIPAQIKEWLPCQVADLQVLVERGWLQRNGLTYSVHQMVQQSVRLQQKPDLKDCQGLIEAFGSPNFIPRDTAYGEASTRLSLAKALLDWFDPAPLDEDFARCLSYTAGSYEQNLGDYPRALELYQKALAVREKALGPDHPDTAASYNNLAGVYYRMGDYKSALDLFLHSYLVLLKRLGRLHPTTLKIKANLEVVFNIVKPSDQPFEKWLEEQAR